MKIKMKLEISTLSLVVNVVLIGILLGFVGLILAAAIATTGFDFLLNFYYLIALLIILVVIIKKIVNAITLETHDSIKIDNSVSVFQKEFEKERKERE